MQVGCFSGLLDLSSACIACPDTAQHGRVTRHHFRVTAFPAATQVRTKQEEVDHKEEVLAVLMERYASPTDALGNKSHLNLGLLGLARQPSVSALSKVSMVPDSKTQAARQAQGDIKRLGSSRGRLDIKVSLCSYDISDRHGSIR